MSINSRRMQRADKPTVGLPSPAGFPSLLLDEQFSSLSATRWKAYDNSTFGAPTRVQRYMAYNTIAGTGASTGATGGTSLRLKSVRESVGGNPFTAGMVDTKSVGYGIPLYCYVEFRHKIPHGQGLWPAAWLTSRVGGASVCELDIMEYFHAGTPGRLMHTLHRADSDGVLKTNVSKNYGGTFFEAPTYNPQWHTSACSVEPENGVNATAGVRFKGYVNGVLIWNYLDTQATWWTSNGSSDLSTYWNVYLQGCQIDGEWVGHPDDPLGYSHWRNACLISGTPPNTCSTTYSGQSTIRAGAPGSTATITGQPSTTYEVDYMRVWTK